ncbi:MULTISPECIES: site-2 protease family protein [Paraburkholderia]|uniref:Zn-dependent protease n=2 Tax=Paraburkholderia TaxID=1822464 RepID=A0A7Y9W9J3_9BURK|nr:site-2 protease family protein [Paraburkholderia bryophila]NYH16380.1 Zn-dependent protease [Paraburkholderia bryophila]NYH25191.1 Zn-dependent protease [Paraburkholderia bryophila]
MSKLLILLLGGVKLGKVLTTTGSMLLTIAVYAAFYGWPFAAGFVALLFVHEAGHYVAAKQRGLDVGLPTFVPFVGAWIQLKELPHDAETEAYVGLAGPFAGTLAALACYFIARRTDSNLLLALSYAGFFLNLFNLIPLSPFDGGRITAVLSPRIWFAGVPVLLALFLYRPSPLLVIMAILALPQLKRAWHYDAADPQNVRYYALPASVKFSYAFYYLALLVFLAMMTFGVRTMLTDIHHG